MSARHGDAANDHNDTSHGNNSTDVVDKLTAYCRKPFVKGVSGESSQPFISFCLLLSVLSVCSEDELGMAEPLHELLATGSGGEGAG